MPISDPTNLKGLSPAYDWFELSPADRAIIEDRLMSKLIHDGIEGAVARWTEPIILRPWQLVIQTSWCAGKPSSVIDAALVAALVWAGIFPPRGAVILMGSTGPGG